MWPKRSLEGIRNVHSLSDFKRRTSEYMARLKRNGSPLVLTVNGEAKFVVLGPAQFQRLAELAEEAETIHAIQEGLKAFERGEGRPARQALGEIRRKYAKKIPR
jgi:prevent-host-death family protein